MFTFRFWIHAIETARIVSSVILLLVCFCAITIRALPFFQEGKVSEGSSWIRNERRVTRLEENLSKHESIAGHAQMRQDYQELRLLITERFAHQDGVLSTLFWMITVIGLPVTLLGLERVIVHRLGRPRVVRTRKKGS